VESINPETMMNLMRACLTLTAFLSIASPCAA